MKKPTRRAALTLAYVTPLALALALAAALSLPAQALQLEGAAVGVPSDATDRVVVRYRQRSTSDVVDAATLRSAEQAAGRAGAGVKHLRRTGSGSHVLKLDRRLSLERVRQLAAEIQATDPQVEYAEPDRIMTIQLVPNDPTYPAQWQYSEPVAGLNLPAAWDKSTGTGVVVAVIDTGYRPHADLAANIVPGYDFITSAVVGNDGNGRDADALDPGDGVNAGECGTGSTAQNSSWHGTHVAGTIAALTGNGVGVAGVAFGAKVQPVRVLGKCGGFTSDIADAIIWASGGTVPGVPANPTPARVINMSLGGSGACDTSSQNAINSARSRGTVVVVAAGNSNQNASNASPANCTGVVTVGAVGRGGARAFYSNYGTLVDVSAPGGDQSTGTANGILSTLNAGARAPGADSYAYYQGTSMATPHVAGVAALMLARNPALTPDQVEARLKSSARPLPVTCSLGCGAGLVDASAAVDAAIGAVPAPAPAPAPAAAPTPVPSSVTELEPNNSLAAAQVLSVGATLAGTLASSTDTDYYRFSIAPGRSVVVKLTPNASSDYDLYAYNSVGTRIASSVLGTGAVDSVTLSNSSTTASAIAYVRVIYFSGGVGSSAGTYSLTLQ
jgi:serine protease